MFLQPIIAFSHLSLLDSGNWKIEKYIYVSYPVTNLMLTKECTKKKQFLSYNILFFFNLTDSLRLILLYMTKCVRSMISHIKFVFGKNDSIIYFRIYLVKLDIFAGVMKCMYSCYQVNYKLS